MFHRRHGSDRRVTSRRRPQKDMIDRWLERGQREREATTSRGGSEGSASDLASALERGRDRGRRRKPGATAHCRRRRGARRAKWRATGPSTSSRDALHRTRAARIIQRSSASGTRPGRDDRGVRSPSPVPLRCGAPCRRRRLLSHQRGLLSQRGPTPAESRQLGLSTPRSGPPWPGSTRGADGRRSRRPIRRSVRRWRRSSSPRGYDVGRAIAPTGRALGGVLIAGCSTHVDVSQNAPAAGTEAGTDARPNAFHASGHRRRMRRVCSAGRRGGCRSAAHGAVAVVFACSPCHQRRCSPPRRGGPRPEPGAAAGTVHEEGRRPPREASGAARATKAWWRWGCSRHAEPTWRTPRLLERPLPAQHDGPARRRGSGLRALQGAMTIGGSQETGW